LRTPSRAIENAEIPIAEQEGHLGDDFRTVFREVSPPPFHLARPVASGRPNEKRNVDQLLVERVPVLETAVLPELLPVIGRDDDHGLLRKARRIEGREKRPDRGERPRSGGARVHEGGRRSREAVEVRGNRPLRRLPADLVEAVCVDQEDDGVSRPPGVLPPHAAARRSENKSPRTRILLIGSS
jgi:hypothetical protein